MSFLRAFGPSNVMMAIDGDKGQNFVLAPHLLAEERNVNLVVEWLAHRYNLCAIRKRQFISKNCPTPIPKEKKGRGKKSLPFLEWIFRSHAVQNTTDNLLFALSIFLFIYPPFHIDK